MLSTAFNAGYTLALALVNGSCRLYETCNVKGGICAGTESSIVDNYRGLAASLIYHDL